MLGDFFLVVTPCTCTSWGSCGMARLTRFCTSTWFMFGSVPSANVTVRFSPPSLVDWPQMYRHFSHALDRLLDRAPAETATGWPLAPGEVAGTGAVGGGDSGFCAPGRAKT